MTSDEPEQPAPETDEQRKIRALTARLARLEAERAYHQSQAASLAAALNAVVEDNARRAQKAAGGTA